MRIKIFIIFSLLCTSIIQAQTIQEIESNLKKLDPAIRWHVEQNTQSAISNYLNNPYQISRSLERFQRFENDIENALNNHSVPSVFKYAALALSDCNLNFKDEYGGSGFFAMRYNLAVNQGLHISSYVDERRDVVKSSEVFARLLKTFYTKYNDWNVAYTVYCITELEWEKAVILSGSKDFAEASEKLSTDFQVFVPKFNAAVYVLSQVGSFSIKPTKDLPKVTQNVSVNQMVSLTQISQKLDIPLNILRELNPIYKKDIIPRSIKNYDLTLPENKIDLFLDLGEDIYVVVNKPNVNSKDSENDVQSDSLAKSDSNVSPPKETPKVQEKPKPNPNATVWVNYTVKKGDVLYALATYFNCSVKDIQTWNNLSSDRINVGQVLKMKVPESKKNYYASINRMTPEQKAQLRKR